MDTAVVREDAAALSSVAKNRRIPERRTVYDTAVERDDRKALSTVTSQARAPQSGAGRKHYELKIGPIERLPKQQGTRVRIGLAPDKKANHTAYQNISVRIGDDRYVYSEAWSMGAKGRQYDYFSVPPELRHRKYTSTAETWLEPGGIDSSYKRGELHDAESPWGLARGRWERREPPAGSTVTHRKTTLRWRNGKLLAPEETRRSAARAGASR